jgi:hypothetical protein
MVHGQLGQTVCETPITKITKAKWTGDVAQAVEHLLCKCAALSSNPSPTNKEQKSLSKIGFASLKQKDSASFSSLYYIAPFLKP